MLKAAMMALEIIGGVLFGSIALVADGMHMSTHAGALLLAARRIVTPASTRATPDSPSAPANWATWPGSPAPSLAMIAVLIGYEVVPRFIEPVLIHFAEAIPIACLGLAVNVASAWLLSSGGHGHGHHEGHGHAHTDGDDH